MHPNSSSEAEEEEKSSKVHDYYLIRVPKSINPKELNGIHIDLASFGPSGSVVASKSDPDKNYGYDLIPVQKGTSSTNLTLLTTADDDDGDIQIDTNFNLKGCINFYTHESLPGGELKPLVPTCPNDGIEDIVNRARGHSVKRKLPQEQKSSPKKKHKRH